MTNHHTPTWQIAFVGEADTATIWPLDDEEAIMDALVDIAEDEAAKQLGEDADYDAVNGLTLNMAGEAGRELLDGRGQRDGRSVKEPHLYPVRYAVASIGTRTVRLMEFASTRDAR